MARTPEVLPEGTRASDFITIGVIAKKIPEDVVLRILHEEGRQSRRMRKLPARSLVYYVIALAIYMNVSYEEVLRCLLEGLEWLGQPTKDLRTTGKSAISHARSRLGFEVMQRLYEEIVHPIATERSRGAWYRCPNGDSTSPEDATSWHLVSIDGSTLDLPDSKSNEKTFGRPPAARGESAFPKLRFVALAECGTHVLFGAKEGPYSFSEVQLARELLPQLKAGMLCLADRNFYGYDLWQDAAATGADLLWRVKLGIELPRFQEFEDGSFLSKIYPSASDRRRDQNGVPVRVVDYTLKDDVGNVVNPEGDDEHYRLLTTILDPAAAPGKDLGALYHERWEIENAFDEFKTHLRGRKTVLRSQTPALVRQEFYGFLLAHYIVRELMHEAALQAEVDPDELSFTHSVNVIRRKIKAVRSLPGAAPFPPSTNFIDDTDS